jgi:hypothetical protein
LSYSSNATGLASAATGTTSFELDIPSAGDYKIRFRLNLISKASQEIEISTNSQATSTVSFDAFDTTFHSNDSTDDLYANVGNSSSNLWRPQVQIQKNNNFVEIIPAGIQVVSGTGRYSRLSRRDQGSSDIELLEVIDGSVKIQSRKSVSEPTSNATDDKIGLEIDGNIIPENKNNAEWDIGSTSKYWENGYFVHLNGGYFSSTIRHMVAGGVFTGGTNNSSPSVGSAFNISSVTRTAEGVYTVNLSNTTNFSVSTGYVIAQGYGASGDTPSRTPGDNEFVITWGTKVDGSTINISSGDNDTNSRRDFYKCYFTFWSR